MSITAYPKLLPIGPTARRLHVTVKWLRSEAEAGRVPHLQADDRFLFDPNALEQALLKRAGRSLYTNKGSPTCDGDDESN